MKKDEKVHPLSPPAASPGEGRAPKSDNRDILIAELRSSLNDAIERNRSIEEAARQMWEDFPLAYFSVDWQWRVLAVNRAAAALWGADGAEIAGCDLWEIVGPAGTGYSDKHLITLHRHGRVEFEHFSYNLKKWVRITVSSSARSNIRGFSVWIEDLSAQKAQIETHARLWKQHKAMADNSPDIILRFILGPTCVFANRAVERILGLDPVALLQKRPQTMAIPPETATRLERLVKGVFATRRPLSDEFAVTANGAGKHVSWRALPEGVTDSNVDSVLVIGGDVTAEREAEKLKEKLEGELREAQKLEAVGRLSGGIAHDFNNLLAIILGNAELALDDVEESSPLRQNLKNLRTAALRGRELVRQILAFSRKSPRSAGVVPMASLARETVKLLRSAIPANIDVRLDVQCSRDAVRGNVSQMQQVLVNLATNAAQAMPAGGAVTIGLRNVGLTASDLPAPGIKPGDYLALSVTDTGHGMDEEVRSHLFEPFFTQKGSHGGSGLGLSVVYGIVKAHNGAVTVRSAPGEGSTLTVFLPLTRTEAKTDEAHPQTDVKGRGRILFVDDEELVADVAHDALSRLGYEVTTETEPEKALRTFSENRTYDMVITDQAMPEMTGMALARRLLDIRPDLPIILCTGYSSGVNEKSAKAAGIKAFLMKPYTRVELSAMVGNVLRRKQDDAPVEAGESAG